MYLLKLVSTSRHHGVCVCVRGGVGAQICPASINAPEFSIKIQRCLSVWGYLQRQTFAVIPWTLGCDISVYLLHPGVASTSLHQAVPSVPSHPRPYALWPSHLQPMSWQGSHLSSPVLSALLCPLLLPSLPHTSLYQSALVYLLVPFLLAPPGLLTYLPPSISITLL